MSAEGLAVFKIRFKNLSVVNPALKQELLGAVEQVLEHGIFILGPEVERLEGALAGLCERKFCIGVNSGTDALYLALRALDIGPGDEVITTPLSWIATLNAIVLTGATPVFADIADDLNIDPEKVAPLVTGRTKAILPVNFTGNMCRMDRLLAIAQQHNLHLVEDAAQSFASTYQGKPSGSFGVASCLSINPMKNLSSYGEAGAVLTDDPELAEKLRALRYAGTVNREDCHYPSVNGRIDTLQAAMILVNLRYLEEKLGKIRWLADYYGARLSDTVLCPREVPGTRHTFYNYTIMTPRRDELMRFLLDNSIEVKIQHPILMPLHTAYKNRYSPEIPNARGLVSQILCLPCHDKLTEADAEFICGKVREFFGVKA